MDDFFFGKCGSDGKGSVTIQLSEFLKIKSDNITAQHFSEQVNRLFGISNNRLILIDGTSSPDFDGLLVALSAMEIHSVEIEARNDINSNVTATLACNITFLNGVICIRPHWCGYKSIRSDEILSTLLLPIYLHALDKKVVLIVDGKKITLPNDSNGAVSAIFSLASYPQQENMRIYVEDVAQAKNIVENGVCSFDAWEEYRKRRLLRNGALNPYQLGKLGAVEVKGVENKTTPNNTFGRGR
ncbi:MAG: hypothetical protein CK426_09275 [Legionella sp.]|nr:MAG: hypothetical protein CK426_09275 [Legionella sp.]